MYQHEMTKESNDKKRGRGPWEMLWKYSHNSGIDEQTLRKGQKDERNQRKDNSGQWGRDSFMYDTRKKSIALEINDVCHW